MQQINTILNSENKLLIPLEHNLNKQDEDKTEEKILGKKIKNDADLILWLSGKETKEKNQSEKSVPPELNSKVRKKLKNKLIKNAKKCELYYVTHFSNKKCITNKCLYCLKNFFDHNELIRFINFEDFVYYLKYIFYLSNEVFSYSLLNFRQNKKEVDILFSKFESKKENWKFDKEKNICKLCILTLANKPNFVENMKKIFLEKKCEMGIREEDDLIIELNSEKTIERINKQTAKKKRNNRTNKNKLNNDIVYKNDIPKQINIYNSNNINININNANILNNNNYNYNNLDEIFYLKSLFLELMQKINDNSKEKSNSENINLYYTQLFFVTHNIIIGNCLKIKTELENLIMSVEYLNLSKKENEQNNKNMLINIQNSQNYVILFLYEIIEFISIIDNYLITFQKGNQNINIDLLRQLTFLITQNRYNFSNIENLTGMFLFACRCINYVFSLKFFNSFHLKTN